MNSTNSLSKLQTIIALVNDSIGTRVEISDGSNKFKALITKDSKNVGVGKLSIASTINSICWSRSKEFITIHSYTTSNQSEQIAYPPGLNKPSKTSEQFEIGAGSTLVVTLPTSPFDLAKFDNKLDGFSLETCHENIEALERYITTRPPESMTVGLIEALIERGNNFTLFFLSRCTPFVIEYLNSSLKSIYESNPSTIKILEDYLLNFVSLLPPSIDLDREIQERHRNGLSHVKLLTALETRKEEMERFQIARDRELALAEVPNSILSQKDKKRPANLISPESSTVALFNLCYKGVSFPTTIPHLERFIVASFSARLQVLKELIRWVSGSPDENIQIIVDNAYLYPDSPKTLRPFSLTVHQPKPKLPSDKPITNGTNSTLSSESTIFIPNGSAFPAVQPRKAAEHFSENAENFGEWTILLSGRAIRDFRQLKDSTKFKVVEQKMVDLSHGQFWGDNQKKLVGTDTEVPIYEAKVLNDLRLVYQIDLYDEGETSRQIIKVWGLESHSSLDRTVWAALSKHSQQRGKEYRTRCLYRREALSKGAKVQSVTMPQTFPIQHNVKDVEALNDPNLSDKEMLELHDLLALSKFIALSSDVVKSILAQDEEAAHLFTVSGKEKQIIDHPGSSFIIGRSGTGKTTCILFKMVGLERAWEATPDLTENPPRQIFLTQSPVLASRVKTYYTNINKTAATGKLTVAQAEALAKEKTDKAEDLEDLEDESGGLKGLPSRFSDLTSQNFPLFISIDTLLHLLEADYGIDWGKKTQTAGHKQAFKRHAIADITPDNQEIETPVDFDDDAFEKIANNVSSTGLWQHHVDSSVFESWFQSFDKRLTKGLDPTLCWSEILGTIRGSELACETSNGCITRAQYLNLSERTNSTYVSFRPAIYSIFEAYLERKGIQGDFDRADRVHALIRAFRTQGIRLVNQVTHVYVDEVQDLLLAHCSMLRFLTSNPYGWMFAGDTAQTIAAGSSFRFNDLKAVNYRCEERDAFMMKRKPVESALFTLGVNYRSHAGITKVGNILVSALLTLFPNSIDQLPAERGAVSGPKPVWLSGHDEESFTNFLFGESGNAVEFGAEQCILVRNEEAREALREKTSDIGLILTIEESKGLEFSDVLVYDFFSDSTSSASDWRILLSLLPDPPTGVPTFDNIRHAAIGQELRHLYVAVTRARNVLWFVDRDAKGQAVKEFLNGSKVIKVCRPGDELPVIGTASSSDQWSRQGRTMYSRKNYRQAALCFRKAGSVLEESIALAYEDRRNVRAAARLGKASNLVEEYYRVGSAFKSCALKSTSTQAVSLYQAAADLFLFAEKPILAAQCLESAEQYEKAAVLFLKGGRDEDVDDAVRIVIKFKIEGKIKDEVWFSARLLYLKNNSLSKVRDLFEDEESQIQFMESFGFDGQKRQFYLEIGRFGTVAKMDFDAGEFWSAYELFSKLGDRASKISSVQALLELLAQTLPLGCSDDWEGFGSTFETAAAYVKEAETVLKDVGNIDDLDKISRELRMYRLITQKSLPELLLLSQEFEKAGDLASQLNSLDVALSDPPTFDHNTTIEELKIFLKNVKQYATLVEVVASDLNVDNANTRRLFGLDLRTLYNDDSALSELRVLPTSPLKADTSIGETLLATLIPPIARRFLISRLNDFLFDSSQLLWRSSLLFPPCPAFSFTGECENSPCYQQHLGATKITELLYQERVATLVQIIEIVEKYDASVDSVTNANALTRKWHGRLSEALYPIHPFSIGHTTELQELWRSQTLTVTARARKVLYSFTAKDQDVLAHLLPAAIISSDFDTRNLVDLPITKASRPELLDFDHKLITAKIVTLLALDHDAPLELDHLVDAKSSIHVVMGRKLTVDIAFLVHFLEEIALAAFLKISNDGTITDQSYHRLLLPMSLMRRVFDRLQSKKKIQSIPLSFREDLVQLTSSIIKASISGVKHLKYKGASISGYSQYVIAHRLIRLLVLIGINTDAMTLRESILTSIKSLSSMPNSKNYLTNAFIEAEDFSTLQFEVIQRSRRFHLDRMVFLDLSSKSSSKSPIGVSVFRSPTIQGIESQIFNTLSSKSKNRTIVDNSTTAATAEEENNAAIIIQEFLKDRHEIRKARILHDQKPLIAFWKSWDSKATNTKVLILGPLVEFVYALDGQRRRIQKARDYLKKLFNQANSDVAIVAGNIEVTNSLIKEFQSILNNLKPTSNFVKTATIADLQVELALAPKLFQKANDFLLSIYPLSDEFKEQRFNSELVDSFTVGHKGIFVLQRKKSFKANPKVKEFKPALAYDNETEDVGDDNDDEAEKIGRRRAGGR